MVILHHVRGDNVYSWNLGSGCGVSLSTEGLGLLLGADIGECLLLWIHRTVLIPKAQLSGPRATSRYLALLSSEEAFLFLHFMIWVSAFRHTRWRLSNNLVSCFGPLTLLDIYIYIMGLLL